MTGNCLNLSCLVCIVSYRILAPPQKNLSAVFLDWIDERTEERRKHSRAGCCPGKMFANDRYNIERF